MKQIIGKQIAIFILSLILFSCSSLELRKTEPIRNSMTDGIQELIDSLPPEGGQITLEPRVYTLYASVHLFSNVRLTGHGPATVLRHGGTARSKLLMDVLSGQRHIEVEDASHFKPGMDIVIRDDGSKGTSGAWAYIGRIVEINNNTITMEHGINIPKPDKAYLVSQNASIANVFSVITSGKGNSLEESIENIQIDNIMIDGNNTDAADYNSWLIAGIVLMNTKNSTIQNLHIKNSPGEGILMNNCQRNRIVGNIIKYSIGRGIHIGGEIVSDGNIISENIIQNNRQEGIMICWGIQHTIISNNQIDGNLMGIGWFDANPPGGGDRFNLIQGNVITNNKQHGIAALGIDHDIIANNIIMNNSKENAGKFAAIYIEKVQHFVVTGNMIYDSQETKTQNIGILLKDALNDNNTIWGNAVEPSNTQ